MKNLKENELKKAREWIPTALRSISVASKSPLYCFQHSSIKFRHLQDSFSLRNSLGKLNYSAGRAHQQFLHNSASDHELQMCPQGSFLGQNSRNRYQSDRNCISKLDQKESTHTELWAEIYYYFSEGLISNTGFTNLHPKLIYFSNFTSSHTAQTFYYMLYLKHDFPKP
jgi:hypothetical protein